MPLGLTRNTCLLLVGVALALCSPAQATTYLGSGRQERAERARVQQSAGRLRELRAAGKSSGREWRQVQTELEQQARQGQARAGWALLCDQRISEGPPTRRSRTARRRLWEETLEGAVDEPWAARSHALMELVREAPRLGSDWVLGQLEDLERNAQHPDLVAASLIARAQLVLDLSSKDGGGASDRRGDREEARAQAQRLLDRAAGGSGNGAGGFMAEAVERARWRMEHLRPGMQLPDVAALDLHGNEIRLADARGKVGLVHVFGFGAPDIQAELELDRELVERFWDGRFWLIGINEDIDRDRQELLQERYRVEWDVIWEGETPRQETIARRWRLEPRACRIVFDAAGVIRAVDPLEDELVPLLEQLLEETHTQAEQRKRSHAAGSPGGDGAGDGAGDGQEPPSSEGASPERPRGDPQGAQR